MYCNVELRKIKCIYSERNLHLLFKFTFQSSFYHNYFVKLGSFHLFMIRSYSKNSHWHCLHSEIVICWVEFIFFLSCMENSYLPIFAECLFKWISCNTAQELPGLNTVQHIVCLEYSWWSMMMVWVFMVRDYLTQAKAFQNGPIDWK